MPPPPPPIIPSPMPPPIGIMLPPGMPCILAGIPCMPIVFPCIIPAPPPIPLKPENDSKSRRKGHGGHAIVCKARDTFKTGRTHCKTRTYLAFLDPFQA